MHSGNSGTHQTPSMTSHSGFLTRSESFCGSRRLETSTWLASSISPCVRWRMKTGLPRHWVRATGRKSVPNCPTARRRTNAP